LEFSGKITSPTFVIIKRFKLRSSNFKQAFHADLYRLHHASQLAPLGFAEILKDPENIILVEWPERVKGVFPENSLRIKLEHGVNPRERIISIG